MNPLIAVLPFCLRDSKEAARLLEWIAILGKVENHLLLLVADDAVPMEEKQRVKAIAQTAFTNVDTIVVKAPAPVGTNYAVPAAVMFSKAALHIDACLKWNWLWLEPDAVPLKRGWLDALAQAYDACPKRFMGTLIETDQPGVPKVHLAGTAIYTNCCGPELKKYCDGKQHFDMAMADYTVPRAQSSALFFHRWGAPNDPPTFKDVKLPTDGPNVGELSVIPPEAVIFHRNKDGSLIELLKKEFENVKDLVTESLATHESTIEIMSTLAGVPSPIKRRGRPPKKQEPLPTTVSEAP